MRRPPWVGTILPAESPEGPIAGPQVCEGATLDDDLHGRIVTALRADLSPRHVPDTVVQMPAVTRTLSGKKLEVPA